MVCKIMSIIGWGLNVLNPPYNQGLLLLTCFNFNLSMDK